MYFANILSSSPFPSRLAGPRGYKVLTRYVKLMEYQIFVLLSSFVCLWFPTRFTRDRLS